MGRGRKPTRGKNSGTFAFPTRVEFGAGKIALLPDYLTELGITKPLLVTDRSLPKTPPFALVSTLLKKRPWALYAEINPNPTFSEVDGARAIYFEEKCDGILALGGGSAIDAAKGVALAVHHPGRLADYAYPDGPNRTSISPGLPPLLAVPTTAGTGSEIGRAFVLTERNSKQKLVFFSPYLLPKLALLDPTLTFSLPPHLTAATGMDALSHCLEAYVSKGYHPMCDHMALLGMELVFQNLARAVARGQDLEARSNMLLAAMLGAVSFQKGLGLVHAMSHAFSGMFNTPHGLTNAILLPHVMRFNVEAVGLRYAEIYARLCEPLRWQRKRGKTAALELIRQVERLCKRVKMPADFSAFQISRVAFSELTRRALEDNLASENPRTPTSAGIRKILERVVPLR